MDVRAHDDTKEAGPVGATNASRALTIGHLARGGDAMALAINAHVWAILQHEQPGNVRGVRA